MAEKYDKIIEAVVDGDEIETEESVQQYLKDGESALEIMNEGIIKGAKKVGDLFEEGEFFLSDLMLAGNAMKAGMEILTPEMEKLVETGDIGKQKVIIIGTVETDIHDIGKNIVSTMFLSSGYQVIDLGVDVSATTILEEATANQADIVALSALMTTSRPYMEDTIKMIKSSPMKDKIKIIVGGSAVDQKYADGIGADGFSKNAAGAIKLVASILEEGTDDA